MADEKAREAMGDEKTALNEKEQDQSVTMDELDSSKIKFINANGDAEAKVQVGGNISNGSIVTSRAQYMGWDPEI